MSTPTARAAALAAVRAVNEQGDWSNVAVPREVAALDEARDRAFAAHLAYGTIRFGPQLDWALSHVATRPLAEVEPGLRAVLRLGAFQLLHADGVADHAAVGETVSLVDDVVPARRAVGAKGFVNGVLRGLARQLDDLDWPAPDDDRPKAIGRRTAHPTWVVRDLVLRFGAERARSVLEADNRNPGVTLRVVGDPGSRPDHVAALRDAGIDARPGALSPRAIRAPGADPRRLDAVTDGRLAVQDEASMVVVEATGAAPGMRALDLCAGPGGKTGMLADLVGPDGWVVAVEPDPDRARAVEQQAERLGVADRVQVQVADGTDPDALSADEPFDVVLVDAPCTGLGTGRRRPEVRWRRSPDDAATLADLQRRLLRAAAGRVGPGGTLVYSVCTWTAGETDETVAAFLADPAGADFTQVTSRQLLPDEDDTDGMFHAVLRRAGPA